MIRLFVAIDFPKEVKSQLADLVDQLMEDGYPLTFEKEENFHLTLKFLGWVNENVKCQMSNVKTKSQMSKLEQIIEATKRATDGVRPFWFRPTKIGYFLKESLILWVGVEAQEGLVKLVNQLEDEFAKIGFEREKREFTPHITFGKKRHAFPLAKWRRIAEEIKEKFKPEFSKFKVKEITLFQSTLTANGSIYNPLLNFPFKE